MKRKITGYHLDDEGHWVAELDCAHNQHVRNQPPWTNRPWVTTPGGRAARIGSTLECVKCEKRMPPDCIAAAHTAMDNGSTT